MNDECGKDLNLVKTYPKSDTHLLNIGDVSSLYFHFQFYRSEPNLKISLPLPRSEVATGVNSAAENEESAPTVSNFRKDFIEENRSLESSGTSDDLIMKSIQDISLISVNIEPMGSTNPIFNPEIQRTEIVHSATSPGISTLKGHSRNKFSEIDLKKEHSDGGVSRKSRLTSSSMPVVNSSLTIGGRRCRICMSVGLEKLISPCHCKGSLGVIHVSCLERWLSMSGRNSCELCGYRFPVVMTQRYSVFKALVIWLKFSRNRTTFMTDCLFFWTLTVLTASLVVCCIMGSKYFTEQGGAVGMPRALAQGMTDILLAIVICGYAITAYVLWKDHATLWRRWRNATMDVRLVLKDLRHNEPNSNANHKSRSGHHT